MPKIKTMDIKSLLENIIQRQASDLHLIAGYPPTMRLNGELMPLDSNPLSKEELETGLFFLLTNEEKELIINNREIDFSYALRDARFRVNYYYQKGSLAAAFRLIPPEIKSLEDLRLPRICETLTKLKQGLVLVTGPTGHGKSTTLAAMINTINLDRPEIIITIEDPIEFVYPVGRSLVSQRELHIDTHSMPNSLKAILREDPNVVLIGEMRDYETISAAITIAETGHLVFATLHTNSASQTVDRIIDVFPEEQQAQVRSQLSVSLEAILSQRLMPDVNGGRIAAMEVMVATPAVRNLIRENKTFQIDNVIQTSGELGMISMDAALAQLIKMGKITSETGQLYAVHPEEVKRLSRK